MYKGDKQVQEVKGGGCKYTLKKQKDKQIYLPIDLKNEKPQTIIKVCIEKRTCTHTKL